MARYLLFTLLPLLLNTGCVCAISDDSRKLVDSTLTFSNVRENPDIWIGKYIMLGGLIANVKNTNEGGQLEVVQLKLDDNGIPEDAFSSDGRFVATSPNFLDNMIYKPGRLVTLVGEIKGKKISTLDEIKYLYPVIRIKEMHVWKSAEEENGYPYPPPTPYYDPYYSGYGSKIYMLRPTAP